MYKSIISTLKYKKKLTNSIIKAIDKALNSIKVIRDVTVFMVKNIVQFTASVSAQKYDKT